MLTWRLTIRPPGTLYQLSSITRTFFTTKSNESLPSATKRKTTKASETLPELGQAIRRLVNKAYHKAPAEVRETLSTDHFLDALVNSEMRIRIKQSRPANLNQAISSGKT